MTLSQVSLLPTACVAGLAVSLSGSLAGYCDRWLQAALPALVLLAVAAQLEQIGVKRDLQRHKTNRKQGSRKR